MRWFRKPVRAISNRFDSCILRKKALAKESLSCENISMDYNYNSDVMYQTNSSAAMGPFFWVVLVLELVLLIAIIVGFWKMFVKAGKPGWASLIPFYNIYVLLKIVGKPGWWLLLYFIPLVNIVVMILVMLDLAKAFGRSVLFAIFGLIIFTPIGILILGFGNSKYIAPKAK